MNNHTPGPWHYAPTDVNGWVSAGNIEIRQIHRGRGARAPISEYQANARLIAETPNLLAALERIASELLPGDPGYLFTEPEARPAIYIARAAIAKVKGG